LGSVRAEGMGRLNWPEDVGARLRSSIGPVLEGVSGCSLRPTELSRTLEISRVMLSRVLSAIGKEDSVEVLISIPGPETLRSIIRAAQKYGADHEYCQAAMQAIDGFDHLIRDQFGTRAALNAALSVKHDDTRQRFEQASRYQVFKGMSQILGFQGKVWLTCMMFTPNAEDCDTIDISTIHGTSGLRRLRPDAPIQLVYGLPLKYKSGRDFPVQMEFDLTPFFSHIPAPLTVVEDQGKVISTFAPEIGGKDALYDMLDSVHVPAGLSKFPRPGQKTRGTSVVPDVPVVTLVNDVILHGDIFKGAQPKLIVYKTMGKGAADNEDPLRDTDRMATNDEIASLGTGLTNLGIQEIPKYQEMVNYLCEQNGFAPEEFRTYRLQVQYPVCGFQYIMAFPVADQQGE